MASVAVRAPLKVLWLGEHVVPKVGGVVSAVDIYVTLHAGYDASLSSWDVGDDERLASIFALLPDLPTLPYRVRCEMDDAHMGMGLGTSTALLTCAVALVDALQGAIPLDRMSIFERVRDLEARWSGASGVDAAACVFGGTHYYFPPSTLVPLAHLPSTCTITPTAPHSASCTEPISDRGVITMDALVRSVVEDKELPDLDAAHTVLREHDLSSPEVDEALRRVGTPGKVTGRGKGGCVLSYGTGTRIVSTGVEIVDHTLDRPLLPRPYLVRTGQEATATAHPNIALVKYWSKVPGKRQLASNPSVSLTLPFFCTTTTVRVVPRTQPRTVVDARVRAFVDEMLAPHLPPDQWVSIETESNFPSACGIASSASGFAALVKAAAQLVGEDERWQMQWARLGSGSAVRSVPAETPLVSWTGTTAQAHDSSKLPLEHLLVVFDPMPKRVSSSDGHSRARSSAFHDVRCALAQQNTQDVIDAFARGDFGTVRRISEAEALTMHMVAATSDPPLTYVSGWGFVDAFVRYRDERRLEAFFTVDAGANVHLLFTRKARDAVLGWVATRKHMYTLFRGVVSPFKYESVVLSGKRYSGKSTLAEKMAKEEEVQIVELSAALKKEYCALHGVSYENMRSTRALKEAHRAAMIAFGDQKRNEDPYVWCRRAWEEGVAHPSRKIVVSDARRPEDLAFWKACTRCTTVRVVCSDEERARRGWVYDPRIDDAESETALDAYGAFDCVASDST